MVLPLLGLATLKADSSVDGQNHVVDHLIVDGLVQATPGIHNPDPLADGPVIGMNRTIIPPSVVEVHIVVGNCFQLDVTVLKSVRFERKLYFKKKNSQKSSKSFKILFDWDFVIFPSKSDLYFVRSTCPLLISPRP